MREYLDLPGHGLIPGLPRCDMDKAPTDTNPPEDLRQPVAELAASDKGVRFIAQEEGFRARPYEDNPKDLANSNCTQGYGNKLHDGPCTAEDDRRPSVTEPEAYENLQERIREIFAPAARELVPGKKMHQHEFDALVSMVYNLGAAEISGTNLHEALLDGPDGWDRVPELMMRFVKAGDEVECGLYKRRIEEGRIWASADYTTEATDKDCPPGS